MNETTLNSFHDELKTNEELNPTWYQRMGGSVNAAASDPLSFIGHAGGNALVASLISGILSAGTAIAMAKMSKGRIPIQKSVKIINPMVAIGTGIGTSKGVGDFYRKKEINFGLNPIFSQDAIRKYIPEFQGDSYD